MAEHGGAIARFGKPVAGRLVSIQLNYMLRVSRAALLYALVALCIVPAAHGEDGVLVLGRVSDDPKHHYAQLKPLLDYVVPRMADVGIREGRILMANDPQQMYSYLRRERVDWVTETAATGMLLADRANAHVMLITERNGRSTYSSVLFARRGGSVVDMASLRGHTIAFQNRASASAYMVPAAMLLELGYPLEILLSPLDRPSSDAIGFVFARTENNIVTWVERGMVDAGAFSDIDWDELVADAPERADKLMEIGRSLPFPRAVEMVRSGLAPQVGERLKSVLLHASEDEAGRAALAHFFGTSGFHEVDRTESAALQRLRQRALRVKAAVE